MVRIIFPSIISRVNKASETEVSADTLHEAISKLVDKYGEPFKKMIFEESGELNRYLTFYVKGRYLTGADIMETKIGIDDQVVIMVIIGGG